MQMTPIITVPHATIMLGVLPNAKPKRPLAVLFSVDSPADSPHKGSDGLVTTNEDVLKSWQGWMKNQQNAFRQRNQLGYFSLYGIKLMATKITQGSQSVLMLKLRMTQLKGMQQPDWEGDPDDWHDWQMPMALIQLNLEAFLGNPKPPLLLLPAGR